MNKKWRIILLAVIVIVSITAIYQNYTKPIKVAYVGALSGSSSDLGNKTLNGIMIAVEEINQANGINGHPIEITSRDTANKEVSEETLIKSLKDEGIDFIVGLELSSIATKYLPYLDQYNLLGLTPGASTYTLDGKDDHLLRINLSDNVMMRVFADYASENLNLNTIDVIYSTNNLAYSESIYNSFSAFFKQKAGQINSVITFDSTSETNYKDIIKPLLNGNTDGILIVANDFDTATIIQQLRLNGEDQYILTSAWSKTQEFISYIGRDTDNVRMVSIKNPDPKGMDMTSFVEAYKTVYSAEPDYGAYFGYDLMRVLEFGLKQSESVKPEKVKAAILNKKEYNSVLGDSFVLDSNGDVSREIWIVQIESGKYIEAVDNE